MAQPGIGSRSCCDGHVHQQSHRAEPWSSPRRTGSLAHTDLAVSPSAIPTAASAPVLPVAPVSSPAQAQRATGFEIRKPSSGQIAWFGTALPLLATPLGAVEWLLMRSWRRRRPPQKLAELDTPAIDRLERLENLRFSLVSGALVVLSGVSLLHASNPTVGSPGGDYLAVALWGTAIGEGLHLARRLWPFPSAPSARSGSSLHRQPVRTLANWHRSSVRDLVLLLLLYAFPRWRPPVLIRPPSPIAVGELVNARGRDPDAHRPLHSVPHQGRPVADRSPQSIHPIVALFV
jgi:hypothetical protein